MGDPLRPEDLADIREFTVADIQREIAAAPEGPEREALKTAVRDAELASDEEPRQGIIVATEPAVINPPRPDDPQAELPAGDSSGMPPLNEVAEQRAANTHERVITTTPKED